MTWRTTTEDTPTDPRNVYAATKLHQEHLCSAFGREHGVAVTALRYHNVYGPRMPRDTPYAGVASLFRSRLAAGQPPLVFEDGGQTRDFVHVHDVARANVLALDRARRVRRCAEHRQRSPRHRPGDGERDRRRVRVAARRRSSPAAYRLGDVRHVVASPQRARDVLGFRAAIEPDRGSRRVRRRATAAPARRRCGRHASGEASLSRRSVTLDPARPSATAGAAGRW